RPYLERALAIYEKTFGPEGVEVADTLHNLGVAARMAEDFDDAERYYRRALAVLEKSKGPESFAAASTLEALGVTMHEAGRLADAHEHLARALAITEKAAGGDRLEVANASLALGVLAIDEKDFAGAARWIGRARDIYAVVVPGEWREAYGWAHLGEAACRAGENETGRKEIEHGVALFRAGQEVDRQDVVVGETLLAECNALGGRAGDPAKLKEALAMQGPA